MSEQGEKQANSYGGVWFDLATYTNIVPHKHIFVIDILQNQKLWNINNKTA